MTTKKRARTCMYEVVQPGGTVFRRADLPVEKVPGFRRRHRTLKVALATAKKRSGRVEIYRTCGGKKKHFRTVFGLH